MRCHRLPAWGQHYDRCKAGTETSVDSLIPLTVQGFERVNHSHGCTACRYVRSGPSAGAHFRHENVGLLSDCCIHTDHHCSAAFLTTYLMSVFIGSCSCRLGVAMYAARDGIGEVQHLLSSTTFHPRLPGNTMKTRLSVKVTQLATPMRSGLDLTSRTLCRHLSISWQNHPATACLLAED